jgi:hypothetical protein
MAAIARLIEVSFADELDPSSRRMVKEMRGWLDRMVDWTVLPAAGSLPKGFCLASG